MARNTLNTKLSDLIDTQTILNLPKRSALFLHVGVGGGKSYFCKHSLYEAACIKDYKILYLINRKSPKGQFVKEIIESNKYDRIKITTYQAVEAMIWKQSDFDCALYFSDYDYIVLDEYQHFVSDSLVSMKSGLILRYLTLYAGRLFFLSATPYGADRILYDMLDQRVKIVELPASYQIADLQTFSTTGKIERVIDEAMSANEKIIFFSTHTKYLEELLKRYDGHSMFVCSEQNKKFERVDVEARDKMIQTEILPCNLLLATTCLDTGFNLRDANIKHVICDLTDVDQILQCIGRRRILGVNDSFHIYIKNQTEKQLEREIGQYRNALVDANSLLQEDAATIRERHPDWIDFSSEQNFVYPYYKDGRVRFKPNMRYHYCLHRLRRCEEILNSGMSYLEWMCRTLDTKPKKLTTAKSSGAACLNRDRQMCSRSYATREEYLQSLIGQDIVGHDAKEKLYKTLSYRYTNNNCYVKSLQGLNEYITKDGLPFTIQSKRIKHPTKGGFLIAWNIIRK